MDLAPRRVIYRLRNCALRAALVAGLGLAAIPPAAAQSSDDRVQLAQNFFDRLFSPFPRGGNFFGPAPEPPRAPAESTRAPAPRKPDTPPTNTVMIFGDSLAEWLAYGLEEAMVDTPEIGVVRKARIGSGLIRYDQRNETQEWAQIIREALAAEKPAYVVMMIGLNDRQAIRVKQGARTAAPKTEKTQDPEQDQENPEQATPEAQRERAAPGVFEFQSERWEELYSRRVDDTIAALKSRGVPVFWVGMPALRGSKATNEAAYLNELFRARAEKAGITYVDVWDGFVDEKSAFIQQGPDYEGQNRRLRTGDGVHFTRPGARKLAHYLEREINRVAPLQATPVALPEPQMQAPTGKPGGPTARPLAGPAVPLAPFARAGEDLIGGMAAKSNSDWASQMADVALVKGEAVPAPAGRADDFTWPRRAIAPFGSDPVVTSTTMPVPLAQLPPPPPKTEPVARTAGRQGPGAPFGPTAQAQQGPPRAPPRPSVFNPFSFFGLFR